MNDETDFLLAATSHRRKAMAVKKEHKELKITAIGKVAEGRKSVVLMRRQLTKILGICE